MWVPEASGALYLDKCLVNGNIDVTTNSVLTRGSHGAFTGSLITGDLTSVSTSMNAVSSSLAALAANLTFGSLSNTNETFTNSTTGSTYVIDIDGSVTTTNPYTWTFHANDPSDKFVVNITGNLAAAQLMIILMGGITESQVISI